MSCRGPRVIGVGQRDRPHVVMAALGKLDVRDRIPCATRRSASAVFGPMPGTQVNCEIDARSTLPGRPEMLQQSAAQQRPHARNHRQADRVAERGIRVRFGHECVLQNRANVVNRGNVRQLDAADFAGQNEPDACRPGSSCRGSSRPKAPPISSPGAAAGSPNRLQQGDQARRWFRSRSSRSARRSGIPITMPAATASPCWNPPL